MTTKKTKTTTGKFNEIKISYVAKADDFIDIRANVPEDVAEFFDKHKKNLIAAHFTACGSNESNWASLLFVLYRRQR